MQIEITERIEQVRIIDIELPYYYKFDLSEDRSNDVIYGKIEAQKHSSVQERKSDADSFELETEEYNSIKQTGLANYFQPKYKSSKEEYEAVKQRALDFLKTL